MWWCPPEIAYKKWHHIIVLMTSWFMGIEQHLWNWTGFMQKKKIFVSCSRYIFKTSFSYLISYCSCLLPCHLVKRNYQLYIFKSYYENPRTIVSVKCDVVHVVRILVYTHNPENGVIQWRTVMLNTTICVNAEITMRLGSILINTCNNINTGSVVCMRLINAVWTGLEIICDDHKITVVPKAVRVTVLNYAYNDMGAIYVWCWWHVQSIFHCTNSYIGSSIKDLLVSSLLFYIQCLFVPSHFSIKQKLWYEQD